MNPETEARAARDSRRFLRYAWRIPLIVLHLIAAIPIASITQGRAFQRRGGADPWSQRSLRWWSRTLLRILGIRVRVHGTPVAGATMFVANHTSWLDIEVVHTQRAACFVAKAEIERWPLVGWLAARGGTIFHRRGSNDSLARVMGVMTERLRTGRSVAAFPEGGTGEPDRLRIFHARIFQAALDADAPIQPVALRYVRQGRLHAGASFARGERFFPNVWRLLGERGFEAEVHFLAPLTDVESGRRHLAELARARIADALGLE